MSIGRWRRSGQAAGADRINVAVCHCASKPIPCHAISVLSIEQVWEAQRRAEAAAKAAAAPRLPGKESVSERVRADLADVLARLGFVRAPGRDGRGPGYVSTAYLRSTGNSWHQLSVSVGEDGDTQRAFSVEGIPYFVRRHDDLAPRAQHLAQQIETRLAPLLAAFDDAQAFDRLVNPDPVAGSLFHERYESGAHHIIAAYLADSPRLEALCAELWDNTQKPTNFMEGMRKHLHTRIAWVRANPRR